jgi:phage tail-like protein
VDRIISRFCPPPALQPSGETILFRQGRYISAPLDSRIYRCLWHRVALRAAIPEGAAVVVETLTSEAAKTAEEIASLPDSRWETAGIHDEVGEADWDCLVRSQAGRYLWLRLTLTGNGIQTPEVTRVQMFFPRATSLQYLPAVYSEDAESRLFLDRFLSVFDTIRGAIGQRISDIALLLDPRATPAGGSEGGDFLTWLASWVGLAFDQNLPESRRRDLLLNAHRLYRLRGTPEGLSLHIRLYTGRDAHILEHFRLRQWLFVGNARLGAQSQLFGADIVQRLQLDEHSRIGTFQLVDSGDPLRDPFHQFAHQFTVFVASAGDDDEDAQQRALERVLELSKPAHTQGFVKLLRPRFRIGIESYVGLSTAIGCYPRPRPLASGPQSRTGDMVLGESPARPPSMRIGTMSRIGSSTRID